jgi:ubiquinone/menaquinone biosynthesis C-methylase UbiE
MSKRTMKTNFKMMSFVHETLYGLFRDPYKVLDSARLKPGQDVLEVGCGPGFFTVPAARIVGESGSVLALDVNPVAVEHVQQKIEEAGMTNARAIVANAGRTDLSGQSFDLIFVFGLARPIGDMGAMWAELDRLLKPQGTLSIEGRLQPPSRLFQLAGREGRIVQFRKKRG